MLVNDVLYFQTFCKLLETVVEAGGLEIPVEHLQKNHFYLLSRKINVQSGVAFGIQPATIRDYRYIYKGEKKFSVRQNRLDLMCEFLGYSSWNDFKSSHCTKFEHIPDGHDTVRLLILPDKRFGAIQHFEGQIGELINNRYEDLKDEYNIQNLEIIYQEHLRSAPKGIQGIRDLGLANEADMILWTEYIHGASPMMRVRSLCTDMKKKLRKGGKPPYRKADDLIHLQDGAFLQETDSMVFFMLGSKAYEKGETAKAREYFKQVLQIAPDHEEAFTYLHLLNAEHQAPLQIATSGEETITEQESILAAATHREVAGFADPPFQKATDRRSLIATNQLPYPPNPALQDHQLLILKGDHRVLKAKGLEPLIRNTLIHKDEIIIFLTTQPNVALLSMDDLTVFKLAANKQAVPIKEALVHINQGYQIGGRIAKKDEPQALQFHSGTASADTEKNSSPNDLLRIIILPNTGEALYTSRQLEAS